MRSNRLLLLMLPVVAGLCVLLPLVAAAPSVVLPGTSTTITGVYLPYTESEYLNVTTTIEAFLGIPFAEPPVGELRFKNPVKKGDLGDEYLATENKSPCPQGTEDADENCLFLSVHTVSPRPTNAPVLIWIHGGAYTTGAGSWSSYAPEHLVALAQDIVIVRVNYRLGVLGFLTTGDSSSPGNYGMLDQVMALKWVQDNIAAFGGDPTRVTIMGESAGASSVGLHLVSPLSGNLFSQAIMQSGNALCPWAADTSMERQVGFTRELAERSGCPVSNNDALMACLRERTVQQLLTQQFYLTGKYLISELLFVPVIDNYFLPDAPLDIVQRNEFHSVPTLMGTTHDEGTLLALRAYPGYLVRPDPPTMSLEDFREFVPSFLYYSSPLVVAAVEQWYIDWTKADHADADHLESFIQLNTDQVFACATEAMARALESTGVPVYRYEMTHVPSRSIWGSTPGWMGAGHGEDIQFVFAWGLDGGRNQPQTDEEKTMSVHFMRYWTNFVRSGDPNSPVPVSGYPAWPRYSLPDQDYKILDPAMENGQALRMDTCTFWLNFAPALLQQDGDPDDLYQDWKQEYVEWRDVHMAEWEQAFQEYQEDGGCTSP